MGLLTFHVKGVFKAIVAPGPLPLRWYSPFSGLLDVLMEQGCGSEPEAPCPAHGFHSFPGLSLGKRDARHQAPCRWVLLMVGSRGVAQLWGV